MKVNILLQLRSPYLPPILADEIRAEVAALNPRVHLVMAGWPWLEVRGLTQLQAVALVEGLRRRGVEFRELEGAKRTGKARVQVSEILTGD